MSYLIKDFESILEQYSFLLGIILVLVVIDSILRMITLWQSARRNQIGWFVFLALINSLGILPVIYLIMYRNKDKYIR